MREAPPSLDARRILQELRDHDVSFVIIGGIAGQLWGSPSLTGDLDICYARTPGDLERLAASLRALKARLRGPGVPADLPFRLDAQTLERGDHFTLRTEAGDLDCLGTPAGTRGYEDVASEAVEVEFFGMPVQVVSLEQLMRMKRAAGRAKDRAELEILGALRDELERRGKLDSPMRSRRTSRGGAGRNAPGPRPKRSKQPRG